MEPFKIGEFVTLYSSVGAQIVKILEMDLVIETEISQRTPDMLMVQYQNGGRGFAHVNQVRKLTETKFKSRPNFEKQDWL